MSTAPPFFFVAMPELTNMLESMNLGFNEIKNGDDTTWNNSNHIESSESPEGKDINNTDNTYNTNEIEKKITNPHVISEPLNREKTIKQQNKMKKIQSLANIKKKYSQEEQGYVRSLNQKEKEDIEKSELYLYNLEDKNDRLPMRFKIIKSNMVPQQKKIALKKIEQFNKMCQQSSEYNKMSNWLSMLVKIPFNKYAGIDLIKELSLTDDISMDEDEDEKSHQNNDKLVQLSNDPKYSLPDLSYEKIRQFIYKTKNILDKSVYGHQHAKDEIIRFLAKWIINRETTGCIIGIHGEMGTGKTSLVKDGICKALQLPFASIPLGGCNDISYLDGHSYTYEGSKQGRIVECIVAAQAANLVLYFDELCKISNTTRGEAVENLLIHLTDPQQNNEFHDRYFSEYPINLRQAIQIYSFNDITKVNPILLDRMTIIHTKSYDTTDKIEIAKYYLLQDIAKQYKISSIKITDDQLKYIIKNTDEEKGVRNLKRSLEYLVSTKNYNNLLDSKCEKILTFDQTFLNDKMKTLKDSKHDNDNDSNKMPSHNIYV